MSPLIIPREHSAWRIGSVALLAALAAGAAWAQANASASSSTQQGRVLELSVRRAIEIAMAPTGNAAVQIAEQYIRQAESRSGQARAALLPDVSGAVGQQNRTVNLQSFGIILNLPIPGFQTPELVGPFNTFDARGTLNQTVFNFSSIRQYQASRVGVREARAQNEDTKDQVAGQVTKFYLAARQADSRVEAAEANVTLAQALLDLARNQKQAGTGTGIEVTRAEVQLANERQQLLVATNSQTQTHLQLLKAIGLDLDVEVKLTDALEYTTVPEEAPQEAIKTAWDSRADLLAQQRRVERMELSYSAVKWERLPSLYGLADYGTTGSSINNSIPTRRYGWQVEVPVFDGGRRDARRAESLSMLEQERIRMKDLRAQIALEVRLALDGIKSAADQVRVSEEGLKLAQNELEQAQRRYRAGVANSVEVTDAQTRLSRARENRITALFNFNMARIDLSEAKGTIRNVVQAGKF